MSARLRVVRLFSGVILVTTILVVAFALLPDWIHTWGATEEEIGRAMPGDEILPQPALTWTHGIIIQAPPEEVWPWIAQIGDDRGGFYSYTFIENLIDPDDRYHNANEILPVFQDPQPGEGLIMDYLIVDRVEPGQYLLAQLADLSEMEGSPLPSGGWTWLWHLSPSGEGATRLVVRMHIQLGEVAGSSLMTGVMDVGGFVMERRMMQGIKDRAEGRLDPPGSEAIEIGLWVVALAAGLTAAVLFLLRSAWQIPLLLALFSVFSLLAFTFLQPPILIRVLIDAVLVGGLVVFILRQRAATPRDLVQTRNST
ncbi:MAG: hypothetical protein P8129_21770 [Anaerolineae bacterium]